MRFEEERSTLVRICHLLFERKLVAGADGNISMRLDENTILITPSEVCKGFLEPEQLLLINTEGKVLEGQLRSTKETKLHLSYYKNRPDVKAVLHTHPPCATAFAACNNTIPFDVLIELPVLIGETRLLPYARPGSEALFEWVDQNTDSDVLLLANHGLVVAGSDLQQAFVKMDALENAAQTILNAKILGTISYISDEEVKVMRKVK